MISDIIIVIIFIIMLILICKLWSLYCMKLYKKEEINKKSNFDISMTTVKYQENDKK